MIKKIIFTLTIASIAFIGCKKVPDEGIEPVDRVTSTNFPKNYTELESFLISGYSNFRKSFNLYGFELLTTHFASLEHTANLDYSDDANWVGLAKAEVSASNPFVDKLWDGLYIGVKEANVALERADFYENNFAKPSELASIEALRGEAYFLRAWYYFHLECFFGESYMSAAGGGEKRGVPLVIRMPLSLEEASQPRASVQQVWDQIIADLKLAAEKLHGVNRTGVTQGRASEWAAKALLGKAYVFTGQWDLAKATLKDVIDNSGKSLMPFEKYRNAFNALPESNEFNEESLFEINVERISSGSGIFTSGTSPNDLTTSQGLIWGPMILGYDGLETGGGNIDMSRVNIFVHDKNIRRFGFTLPVFDTIQAPGFAGTASRTNPQYIMDPAYKQQSLDLRTNKTTDPRLYVCAQEPFIDSVTAPLIQNGPLGRVPIARAGHLGNIYNSYGWSFKKYTTVDRPIYQYNSCDGANYYLLRLADVYLLYAEACKNSGDNVNALEYINKVHRRAYGVPVNVPSAQYDYQSLTALTKAAPSDASLANNPLAYERFVELFAEGHWWFDVCRWRLGENEANYYVTGVADGTRINWSNQRSYAYPIPSIEMSGNAKIAGQQNPGY